MPHHQKCSRSGWMMLWATWSGECCLCPQQGGWSRLSLEVPSNLNHSVLLCICNFAKVPRNQQIPSVLVLCAAPIPVPSDHFCPCCLLHLVHNSFPNLPSLEDKCMQKRCRCLHALGEEICYRQLEKCRSSLCQRGCLTLEFTRFLDAFWVSAEFFA